MEKYNIETFEKNSRQGCYGCGCLIVVILLLFIAIVNIVDDDNTADNINNIETVEPLIIKEGHPKLFDNLEVVNNFYTEKEMEQVASPNNKLENYHMRFAGSAINHYIVDIYCDVKYFYPDMVLEDSLPIIRSYLPVDIINEKYRFISSEIYLKDDLSDNPYYYVIEYEWNKEKEKCDEPYTGSIYIIIIEDRGRVLYFTIDHVLPNWMSDYKMNGYKKINWGYFYE